MQQYICVLWEVQSVSDDVGDGHGEVIWLGLAQPNEDIFDGDFRRNLQGLARRFETVEFREVIQKGFLHESQRQTDGLQVIPTRRIEGLVLADWRAGTGEWNETVDGIDRIHGKGKSGSMPPVGRAPAAK
jgi:hypothetical protein